jgi:hypothetical protein
MPSKKKRVQTPAQIEGLKKAREAKKAREEATFKMLKSQQAEIDSLKAMIADQGNKPDADSEETTVLRAELEQMKLALMESGGLPKKVSTHPWRSVERPNVRDIFKTKKQHKGFELVFILPEQLDDFQGRGYTVAKGEDYGHNKPGSLKRRRMIGVERPVKAADADRTMQREFNKRQKQSTLQDPIDKNKQLNADLRGTIAV